MRILPILAAVALATAGCTTVSGSLAQAPDSTHTLALSPDAARDCLIAASPTGFKVAAFQGGYRIWTDGGTGTSVNNLAVVRPTESGSTVEVWHRYGWNPFPRALAGCSGV